MAGIKIVDLPPLGRDLASTDLLELSLAGGTGSRKITGQEIMNTSKLNIGTTAITSGTVGRVLFEGTGNVVSQSANLFWDDAANRLIIGGSTASNVRANTNEFNIQRDGLTVPTGGSQLMFNLVGNGQGMTITNQNGTTYRMGQFAVANVLTLGVSGNSTLNLFTSGNIGVNTTTDAGFRLDVNGTARALNNLIVYGDGTSAATRGTLTIQSLGETHSGRLVFSRNNSNWYNQIETIGSGGGANLGLAINDNGTYSLVTNKGKVFIGNSLTIPTTATLQVGGAGNTSATTSLLVQQSTGVNVLSVRDDMYVTVQNTNNTECFQVRGANDDATIRFTPSGGTSNITLRSQSSSITLSTTANSFGDVRVSGGGQTLRIGTSSASGGGINYYSSQNGVIHSHRWFHNNVEQMSLQYTGNFLIGTTTDAGFRLDVNGTARVSGVLTGSSNINGLTVTNSNNNPVLGSDGNNIYLGSNQLYRIVFSGNAIKIQPSNGTTSVVAGVFDGTSALCVGVNSIANASAILEASSTTRGFLPPRMTQTQRNAIASPAIGLEIYQTDATEGKYIYKSSGWTYIG